MPPELIDAIVKGALLIIGLFSSGGTGAFVMRSWMRRIDRREKVAQDRERQQTETIAALSTTLTVFVKSTQENVAETRENTRAIDRLVEQISKNNEIEAQQRQSSLEGQIGLAKHLASNTQNLQELSETFNKVGSDLKKAIDKSGQDVSENSRNLAKDIKGAVADEVSKLDGAIVPLTKEFQEAILALTKALELLTQALGKINDIGANQEEIKKLVEQARMEIKDQLAKPMPAEVLPGPTPPPEPPKEPSAT